MSNATINKNLRSVKYEICDVPFCDSIYTFTFESVREPGTEDFEFNQNVYSIYDQDDREYSRDELTALVGEKAFDIMWAYAMDNCEEE